MQRSFNFMKRHARWKALLGFILALQIIIFSSSSIAAQQSDVIQPAGVGNSSWPVKCPAVIDTQHTDQPKVAAFKFDATGQIFTRLADGSASPTTGPENVIGCYADFNYIDTPGANGYHLGTISRDAKGYYWENAAGIRWGLTLSGSTFLTDKDNPYYSNGNQFIFVSDLNIKYFPDRAIVSSDAISGSPGYYVSATVVGGVPTTNQSGFGWYSTLWPLIEKPVSHFQVGLSSTWIGPDNSPNNPAVAQKLCATSTNQYLKDLAGKPSSGNYGYYLFQTIEGSLGWWGGEKYPSIFPKYQANATQNCYTSEIATPGWGFYRDEPTPRNATGFIQISNQIILPPDGLTFQADSNSPQLGVTWLSLPLPKFDHQFGGTAGENSWTLFMKTGNFSGPVQFVAPQFWVDGSISNPIQNGLTLDKKNGSIGQLSSEWNSIPYYETNTSAGVVYSKLPPLQLQSDSASKLVFSRDLVAYGAGAVANQFAQSLKSGTNLPSTIDSDALKLSLNGLSSPVFQNGKSLPSLTTILNASTLNSGGAYGLNLTSANTLIKLPQYFQEQNGIRTAVPESTVPQSLKEASFEPTSVPTFVYESPNWWGSSPTASPTFNAQLNDGSSVEYKWYKFVDQPALQRFELNATEKANLQAAAEKMQKDWAKSQLIKDPSSGSLTNFDSGLLVTPPSGLEIGYVPIVVKQYYGSPKNTPTPTTSKSPTPTPTPTPTATPTATPKNSPSPKVTVTPNVKKLTINCVKGKLIKKITAVKPVCPKGYKKKTAK
ncbi:MAG: hypothetical protein F2720_05195 [Actinobacteria bacterium]|nr:hypothetical protein [Actinomycetota bacterium]